MNTTGILNQADNSNSKHFFNNSEQVKKGGQYSGFERSDEKQFNVGKTEPFTNISNRVN